MTTENERLSMEIDGWLAERPEVQFAVVNDILDQAISRDRGRTRRAMQMRLAGIMRDKGWRHERRMLDSGVRVWGFVKP